MKKPGGPVSDRSPSGQGKGQAGGLPLRLVWVIGGVRPNMEMGRGSGFHPPERRPPGPNEGCFQCPNPLRTARAIFLGSLSIFFDAPAPSIHEDTT